MIPYTILTTEAQKDYELIDSGSSEKLERYGSFLLARPDPQALWKKMNSLVWKDAHGVFVRTAQKVSWRMKPDVPESWIVELGNRGLRFVISPTAFKHTGVFPEQVSNWQWMADLVGHALMGPKKRGKISVLNLFAYTGGASLALLKAGASVVHVDGSKSAIAWAKENAAASGLSEKPIRYILDDVRKFVAREIKRGNTYDGIILDPPAFGHGAGKEIWKIEEHLPDLLLMCKELLSKDPLFFLMNGYASGYSAIAYGNNIKDLIEHFGGSLEIGELTIAESKSDRLLPCGIFARWKHNSQP